MNFPGRLHHDVPSWVDRSGAVFHIRIRVAAMNLVSLTDPPQLLSSVVEYSRHQIWWPVLFLLMPDHVHALLSFHPERRLSRVVGDWKKWNTQKCGLLWQDNFFDHRLRRGESIEEKSTYIRKNPVVKGLCSSPDQWPWVLDAQSIQALLKPQ